jgi:hypothetical protein
MTVINPAADAWLAAHHNVITSARLTKCRVGDSTLHRLVRTGVLERRTRGVYVLGGSTATLEQRCAIVCAAHPAGFITGPTAGMLAKLRRMPAAASLHFASRHGVHLDAELGVLHRQTCALGPSDRTCRGDGITVASSARLAFDLARDLRQLDHRSVVQQLLDQRRVTVGELDAVGERLCHPARPGSATFRRTLSALGGGAAQDSHGEVALLDALRRRGIPAEAQVPVVGDAAPIHLDLGVAAVRWGVELDIHPEHRTLEGHRRDAARRRLTNDQDWQVELVTELDLGDVPAVADRLASSYRLRARRRVPDRSA